MQWRPKTPTPKTSTPTLPRPAPAPPPPLPPEEPPSRPRGTRKPTRSAGGKKKARKEPRFSRLHKPEGMSLEDWQIALRRQFGREQNFLLKNLGDEPIFSEFEVTNP